MIFVNTTQKETSLQKSNVNNEKESKREWKKREETKTIV